MIWQHKDCPICGLELQAQHSDPSDPIYLLRCPTTLDIPIRQAMKIDSMYAWDSVASHFEVEYQNHKPTYMVVRLFPFALNAYDDVCNIYKYDEDVNQRFIVETKPFEIPWKDKERLFKKLNTYTTFS